MIARARGEGLDRDDNFPTLAASGAPLIHDKAPRIFHFPPEFRRSQRLSTGKADLATIATCSRRRLALFYDRYALRDFVFKAVGVGSVGTYCYVGLFMTGDDEPIFLQVKEAVHSVLEVLDDRLALSGPSGPSAWSRASA